MNKKVLSPEQLDKLRKYISNPEKYMELFEMMDAFPVIWFTEKGYTTDEDEAIYNMPLCFQIRKNDGWWQAAYINIRDGDVEKNI